MYKMRVLLFVVIVVCSGAMGANQDEWEKKLERLEARIESLEQQNRQLKTESSKPDEAKKAPATVEVEELRRQVGILAEELERLRSGEEEVELSPEQQQTLGLSPSAAGVYRKEQGVSIAGYGEMLYENFDGQNQAGDGVNKGSQMDFLRAILYAGYRFNDRFLFNSEIEFEHSTTDKSGSASVEFAYIEYLLNENLSARGGLLLVPMGLVNEFHEPNVFLGSLRPQTERVILPSTWRENGFGLVGNYGNFNFRSYWVNGLDATGFGSKGLRGGRQKGSKAKASDMAFVGRLDYAPTPGFFLGGSLYRGGSGQDQFLFEERNLDVDTTIWEVHGQLQMQGWDLRGLYAAAIVSDAAELSILRGLSGNDGIAEKMEGGYLQVGYNVLSKLNDSVRLTPYYRFESIDTQSRMPVGFFNNPANDNRYNTLGLELKPIYNVVIKADYNWNRNGSATGLNQFNVGLGYSF